MSKSVEASPSVNPCPPSHLSAILLASTQYKQRADLNRESNLNYLASTFLNGAVLWTETPEAKAHPVSPHKQTLKKTLEKSTRAAHPQEETGQ